MAFNNGRLIAIRSRPRSVRITVPVTGAREFGQCDKVRTVLWVTIGDVGAAGTSATVSVRTVSILLVVEWMDSRHPAILEMTAVETASVAEIATVAAVIVAASAAAIAAETVSAAGRAVVAALVVAAHAAAAVLEGAAVSIACLPRSLAPAKER